MGEVLMKNNLKTKLASLKEKAENFSLLYVEDEEILREGISTFLNKIFTKLDLASNGEEGLKKYTQNRHDIVITDIQMPKMDGLEMTSRIKEIYEKQEIIVISAYTDPDYFTRSIELGVTGYIIKPIDFYQILKTLEQSIEKLSAFRQNEIYKTNLEAMVQERTQTVLNLQKNQVLNYKQAIHSLVIMVEARDAYTGGHSQRVAEYSRDIAKAMALSDEECEMIYEAGILHDIGKIVTPDAILLKPSKLTDDEYSLIQEHVTTGYKILSEIPMYSELAQIIYAHHERLDGGGYPRGLKGDEIPLAARIMAVADSFDAMTTRRVYKAMKSIEEAIEELKKYSNVWYDAEVIEYATDVLSSVNLDKHVRQEPASHIDDERFAYFYKDPLTHLYNHYYLDYILQNNQYAKQYLCLNALYIKNFSAYNKKYGWDEGDKVLQGFSNYLKSEFPNLKIFRIFGDDFVLLCKKHFEIDIDKINSLDLLKRNNLHCEHKHFNLREPTLISYKSLQE